MSRFTAGTCVSFFTVALAAAQPGSGVQIRVVEGDGAINSIRLHRGHDPVVEITDSSGEPLAQATVNFVLPGTGPSGTFQAGSLSYTTMTDSHGFAAARGMTPNRISGSFQIRVSVSWRGQMASGGLTQINAEPVAASHAGRKIAILALIAGGAAAGAAAALGHGGAAAPASGGVTASVSGGVIVAGTPSLGPPH